MAAAKSQSTSQASGSAATRADPKPCSSCGRPKEPFHSQECRRFQTIDIIAKVHSILEVQPTICDQIKALNDDFFTATNSTWEELIAFKELASRGCDHIGIHWCQRAFKFFDAKNAEAEKVTILDNVISILYWYNENSKRQPSRLSDECPYCGKSESECAAARLAAESTVKDAITSRIEFPNALETKFKETTFGWTHVAFNLFRQLLMTCDKNWQGTCGITAQQIYHLVLVFVEYHQVMTMIAQADKAIFG
jgi:hypothetical protein